MTTTTCFSKILFCNVGHSWTHNARWQEYPRRTKHDTVNLNLSAEETQVVFAAKTEALKKRGIERGNSEE